MLFRISLRRTSPRSIQRRPGIALIAVVIVIALITTSALTFALLMQQSNQTARQYADQQQSQWAMESAFAQLESFAALPPQRRDAKSLGGSISGFVRSIELQPASEASGEGPGLRTEVEDWVSSEADEAGMPPVEWEDALDEEMVNFDPTQPGFVVFDWTTAEDGQQNVANASTIAPSISGSEDVTVRFGWTNESRKLHLARLLTWEAAGTPVNELLQATCGLSPEQADRLLDWMDADDQPRALGAESSVYAQRGLRYQPANRVPPTLDYLLLIPGFSPRVLYGQRQTMTIKIDAEDPLGVEGSADLADFTRSQQAQLDRDLQSPSNLSSDESDRDLLRELGLTHKLTTTAKERHHNHSGQLKLPVNHPDLQQLFAAVSSRVEPSLATYLCLARQFGVHDDATSTAGSSLRVLNLEEVELDFTQPPTNLFASLVQLIDSHVRVPQPDGSVAVVRSPLRASELQDEFADRVSDVFANLTIAPQPVTDSRLHWRLADPQILRWIPGLTPETQALLLEHDSRDLEPTNAKPNQGLAFQVATWYRSGRISSSQWQIIERELTDGGDVFSAYIGAHAGEYRAFRWGQVIVDGSAKQPQQVYYRELLPPPPTLQAVMAAINETALANP